MDNRYCEKCGISIPNGVPYIARNVGPVPVVVCLHKFNCTSAFGQWYAEYLTKRAA